MRVLTIDDDPTARDLVYNFLDLTTHHDVDTAPSAKAAIEAISDAQEPFECFLCDIQMPEVDGIDLVRMIRENPVHKHTPVIMLTAMHEKLKLDQAFAAGATDFITKPFNSEDLARRIQSAQRLTTEKTRRGLQSYRAGEVKGLGDTLKETMLTEPMALPARTAAIDYTEFENYLRQLLRLRTARLYGFAAKIVGVEQVYAELSTEQFKSFLDLAAHVIKDSLLGHQGVLSYRGNGLFLCAVEMPIGSRFKSYLANLRSGFQPRTIPLGRRSVPLLVGKPMRLVEGSEAKLMDAIAMSIALVEDRVTTPYDLMDAPKDMLRNRGLKQERQHFEARSYAATLQAAMSDVGGDEWLQSRQNSHKKDG